MSFKRSLIALVRLAMLLQLVETVEIGEKSVGATELYYSSKKR